MTPYLSSYSLPNAENIIISFSVVVFFACLGWRCRLMLSTQMKNITSVAITTDSLATVAHFSLALTKDIAINMYSVSILDNCMNSI